MPKKSNIGKETRFKKGESGNPKGRPKKVVSSLLSTLKQEGYQSVGKAQVAELYEALMGLDLERLQELKADPMQPMIIGIVVAEILDKRKAFKALNEMLDRAHGKASQEGTFTIKDIPVPKITWDDEGDS